MCDPRTLQIAKGLIVVAATLWAGNGCTTRSLLGSIQTRDFQPSNVYHAEVNLVGSIKRVAVFPPSVSRAEESMEFGLDTLWPLLLRELGRAHLFELVIISNEELRSLTGRGHWTAEERFPIRFFDNLKEKLAVDAVLFSRLTEYRAYEPLAIGWRLTLLDVTEPQVLWAVDELFDTRVPEVAIAAKRHAVLHPESGTSTPETVLTSPCRFGGYASSALVKTFANHKTAKAKVSVQNADSHLH